MRDIIRRRKHLEDDCFGYACASLDKQKGQMKMQKEKVRACVYTCLLGGYEDLNEQEKVQSKDIPFFCLTDNRSLKSKNWEMIYVEPVFPGDLVRSQRYLKISPHKYFKDYDLSLYIDNSVTLLKNPTEIIEAWLGNDLFVLPHHSFRDTVFNEFLEIIVAGRDDYIHVFEQINQYFLEDSNIFNEKPYWTGILLRRHNDPAVITAMENWLFHVLRYSRRDQLSANLAFKKSKINPKVLKIDTLSSNFHQWPTALNRKSCDLVSTILNKHTPHLFLKSKENNSFLKIVENSNLKIADNFKREAESYKADLERIYNSRLWKMAKIVKKINSVFSR